MKYENEDIPLINETVSTLLEKNAAEYGGRTAFFFDGENFTWKYIDDMTDRIAASMMEQGTVKGTHVGMWSVNHINLVLYMLAAMKIGAVPVVINYSYRTMELKGVLQRADIKTVYIGEQKRGSDYREMIEEVRGECPKLLNVRDMSEELEELRRLSGGSGLTGEMSQRLINAKAAVMPTDVACIAFTSGTTRVPKPAMLTFYNLVNNARQFTARMRVSVENGDVLLAPMPLFHSSGITGMLMHVLVTGVPVVLLRKFQAGEALKSIERYRVTDIMAVPSMLEMMADSPELENTDLSSVRVGQTSGSNITPERLLEVIKKLGFSHFLTGYGQTECSPLITTSLYEESLEEAVKSAGVPLSHEEIRIWVLSENREAATGETGEIQVRGFNTMRGYYNADEENREKFTEDGWLKTTDAGYLDERGRFHFVTRLSDLIIRHGENISPAEVESVIETFSRDITAVKVVGVPAPVVQEEVACVLVCRNRKIDPQELQCFVKQRLAGFKVPRYVLQIDEMPQTPTGKTDQGAVRKLAREYAYEQQHKEEL